MTTKRVAEAYGLRRWFHDVLPLYVNYMEESLESRREALYDGLITLETHDQV